MPGHQKWVDITERASDRPEQQENARQIRNAMETAMALGRLREARGSTQVQLATRMKTSQRNVSRIEHQDDLYLSTLRGYVGALGGKVDIVVSFPDGETMLLEPSGTAQPSALARAARRKGPAADGRPRAVLDPASTT